MTFLLQSKGVCLCLFLSTGGPEFAGEELAHCIVAVTLAELPT